MLFGQKESTFAQNNPIYRKCIFQYSILKEFIRHDDFRLLLQQYTDKCNRHLERACRFVMMLHTVGGSCFRTKRLAKTLLDISHINAEGVRKIIKKHNKLCDTNISNTFSSTMFHNNHLMSELHAIAGYPAPECPVCMCDVSSPVTFGCRHTICSSCAKRLYRCPVCRNRGKKQPCKTWTKILRTPKIPGSTKVLSELILT